MAVQNEGQQALVTVAAEDVVGTGPELDELRKACADVVSTDLIAAAQKLARSKQAIKDLLGAGDGTDRSILVDENYIITEKHGARAAMKSDPKNMQPSIRRTTKATG